MALIRSHTDLAARFLGADVVELLCSGRELATDWPGSNLHVEAALLSHVEQSADLARSRLRSAVNNFAALLRLPDDEQHSLRASITPQEFADLAMAAANTGGPAGTAHFLGQWQPDDFIHQVAAKLTARLADAGRDDEINGLVVVSADLPHVQMAAARTMFDYGIVPAADALSSLVAGLVSQPGPFSWTARVVEAHFDLRAVVWVLAHGLTLLANFGRVMTWGYVVE